MAVWRQAKECEQADNPASWRFFDMFVYHSPKITEFALRCYLCDRIDRDDIMKQKADEQFDVDYFHAICKQTMTQCMTNLLDHNTFTLRLITASCFWPDAQELNRTSIKERFTKSMDNWKNEQVANVVRDENGEEEGTVPIEGNADIEAEIAAEIAKEFEAIRTGIQAPPVPSSSSKHAEKQRKAKNADKQRKAEHAIRQKVLFDTARDNLMTISMKPNAQRMVDNIVAVNNDVAERGHKETLKHGCVKPTQTLFQVIRSVGKNARPYRQPKEDTEDTGDRALRYDDLYDMVYGLTERQVDLMHRTIRQMDVSDPVPELTMIAFVPVVVEACVNEDDDTVTVDKKTSDKPSESLVRDCCATFMRVVADDSADDFKRELLEMRRGARMIYNIAFTFADLWKMHTQIRLIELPDHVKRAQVNAVRQRSEFRPVGPDENMEHALDFVDIGYTHVFICPVCRQIASFVRNYTSARSVTGNSGYRNASIDIDPSSETNDFMFCTNNKTFHGVRCGVNPISRILVIGQALVYNNIMISVCPQPKCGVLTVINPVHMAYTQFGFCCPECTRKHPASNGLSTCNWITQLGIGTDTWTLTERSQKRKQKVNVANRDSKLKRKPNQNAPGLGKGSRLNPNLQQAIAETAALPPEQVTGEMLLANQMKITSCALCDAHMTNSSEVDHAIVSTFNCRVLICTKHSEEVMNRIRDLLTRNHVTKASVVKPECAREGICACISAHQTCTGEWNPATLRNHITQQLRDQSIERKARQLNYDIHRLNHDPRAKKINQQQRARARWAADNTKR